MTNEEKVRVALVSRSLMGVRFKVGDIVRLRSPQTQNIPQSYDKALLCIERRGEDQLVPNENGGSWRSQWRTFTPTVNGAYGSVAYASWYVDERYIDLVCPAECGLTLHDYIALEHDEAIKRG